MANNLLIDLPPFISATQPHSFAAFTIRNRFSVIIDRILTENSLHPAAQTNLKVLLNEILEETVTQKTTCTNEFTAYWHELELKYTGFTYFEVPFFELEAYFYFRILKAIDYFEGNKLDPFRQQKLTNLKENEVVMVSAFEKFLSGSSTLTNERFYELLKLTLWGNSSDLSQLQRSELSAYDKNNNLLIDTSAATWAFFSTTPPKRIEVILDNAGLELITDLILIIALLTNFDDLSVHLHFKTYPTFVSDATIDDFYAHLRFLENTRNTSLVVFGQQLEQYLESNRLVLHQSVFWNSPYHFTKLPTNIKNQFGLSDLVISKGDANYRRFFEDRAWEMTTPVDTFIDYFPTKLLLLRTLKSEILLGIESSILEKVQAQDEHFLTNGKFGIIHYCN